MVGGVHQMSLRRVSSLTRGTAATKNRTPVITEKNRRRRGGIGPSLLVLVIACSWSWWVRRASKQRAGHADTQHVNEQAVEHHRERTRPAPRGRQGQNYEVHREVYQHAVDRTPDE